MKNNLLKAQYEILLYKMPDINKMWTVAAITLTTYIKYKRIKALTTKLYKANKTFKQNKYKSNINIKTKCKHCTSNCSNYKAYDKNILNI